MRHLMAALAAALLLAAGPALAQQKTFRLSADPHLVETEFARYLLPRFSLKTGIRITLGPPDRADALLGRFAERPEGGSASPVFAPAAGGDPFILVIRPGGAEKLAGRFLEWLRSDVGRRTVERFKLDGEPLFAAVEEEAETTAAAPVTGDIVRGEELAFRRCGRCHVINEKNRFGGIGSTPSFGAMKTLPRWQERFESFWTLNPHPAFTQIDGVTEPFAPERPSPIAPIRLTLAELEDLLAFVQTIKVKDLGAPLKMQ